MERIIKSVFFSLHHYYYYWKKKTKLCLIYLCVQLHICTHSSTVRHAMRRTQWNGVTVNVIVSINRRGSEINERNYTIMILVYQRRIPEYTVQTDITDLTCDVVGTHRRRSNSKNTKTHEAIVNRRNLCLIRTDKIAHRLRTTTVSHNNNNNNSVDVIVIVKTYRCDTKSRHKSVALQQQKNQMWLVEKFIG